MGEAVPQCRHDGGARRRGMDGRYGWSHRVARRSHLTERLVARVALRAAE